MQVDAMHCVQIFEGRSIECHDEQRRTHAFSRIGTPHPATKVDDGRFVFATHRNEDARIGAMKRTTTPGLV